MTVPVYQVTVFPEGALVTRRGPVTASRGRIRIGELPLLLEPDSVQVDVPGAVVLRVSTEIDIPEPPGPDDEGQRAWEIALDELAEAEATREGLLRTREALADLGPLLPKEPSRPPPLPARCREWLVLEERVAERIEAIDHEIRELDRRLHALDREIDALASRIGDLAAETRWASWRPARAVVAEVRGDGPFEVTLRYRVPGVRWSPSYLVQVDAPGATARLSLRAAVTQVTGEDWSGVQIRVANGAPSFGPDLLPPPRLHLDPEPTPARGWSWRRTDLESLFPDEPRRNSPSEIGSGPLLHGSDGPPPDSTVPRTLTPSRISRRNESEPVDGHTFADMAPRPVHTVTAPAEAGPRTLATADVVLADRWMAYERLRVASFAEGREHRGRLVLADDHRQLAEAGAPPIGKRRFAEELRDRRSAAAAIARRPLPRDHHLPAGPPHVWDAVGTIDIHSDGQIHTFLVATWPISLAVRYRAVPRNDRRVQRTGNLRLDPGLPSLPGPVHVWVGGEHVHTEPWSGTPELTVPLGPEPRMTLTRTVRYREEVEPAADGEPSFVRSTYTTIELAIGLDPAWPDPEATVEVLERIPVPHTESGLTVEVTEASPAALPFHGDPNGPVLKGGRIQRIVLQPGAPAHAVLGYTVTRAAQLEVVGGAERG